MGSFTGTTGDDSILGTDAHDEFDIGQGGIDTVVGGRGGDTFRLGATLTADDRLDGGGGFDTLELVGDYSAGLVVNSDTLDHFENLVLGAGFSYDLSGFSGRNVGSQFTLNAAALEVGQNAHVDLSDVKVMVSMFGGDGDDLLIAGSGHALLDGGGSGADTLIGGAGNDSITLGDPAFNDEAHGGGGDDFITGAISSDTVVDGGDGSDTLRLVGIYDEPLVL